MVTAQAREETAVAMKDLPTAAQNTIKGKAGSDEILRIEKETRKGKELEAVRLAGGAPALQTFLRRFAC